MEFTVNMIVNILYQLRFRSNKKRLLFCYSLVIFGFYACILTMPNSEVCYNYEQKLFRNESRQKPTVVTAYYDIGSFYKGTMSIKRTPNDYIKWMESFSSLNNYVIFYTDSFKYVKLFERLRKDRQSITKIIFMPRKKLWPFDLFTRIKSVIFQPGYPTFYPNTVTPEYSIVQHSKYAILADAIKNHYIKTDYICWIDVGVFRDITEEKKPFHLEVPPQFDDNMIGFNCLNKDNPSKVNPREIFLQNYYWVAGNAFIGNVYTMNKFCNQYKMAVKYFLSQGLANTDQQVVYAMYTSESIANLDVNISLKLYHPDCNMSFFPDKWFYLAYLMYQHD